VTPDPTVSAPPPPQVADPREALRAIRVAVDETMLVDRHRFRSRLSGIERVAHSRAVDTPLAKLRDDVERSRSRRAQRLANLPRPTYPDNLPVVEKRHDIADAIKNNQVLILAGETGSGKTTQLPKICLELGRGVAGLIGHTQPRRIAARSVATRIAQELNTPLGQAVGYKVRFGDHVSRDSYVKLMTDGILLAETQGDRFLEQYDTLILDEAHERSLNIDFLLGYLKQLLPKCPDLKLIITSATIDPQGFSRHFDNAPVIEVSGRTYPVEVRYRAPESDDPEEEDLGLQDAILSAVDEVWREGPGDVLLFLPGEREIKETAESLRKHHPPGVEVLPLYARLSPEDQMKVFAPHGKPRIVLATNVAETSLTVPGIKYVIDPGTARLNRYSPRTKVQRLHIEPVSQASADQRKGRCGRVSEGLCIRLYSEENFAARPRFTDPEILRTNLASVILQMKALRLGEVQDFPFLEPPDYRAVRDGFATLHELGAIDANNALTPLGAALARLPVDPRIGRMVLAARDEGAMDEVLVIAAALTVQDPRERPMDKQDAADAAHAKFKVETSDFLGYLKLWDWYHEQSRHLSQSKMRKLCQENFLSYVRLREWNEVHQQLHSLVTEMGLHHAGGGARAAESRGSEESRGSAALRRGAAQRSRGINRSHRGRNH
jgi:ATP-dependent helicase HrpA